MIYTFYSYKGGVGRSMAVANVAQWFYEQGLRVIIIDWDLEAPGLESFFVTGEEVEKVRAKPGLIDMLLAYQDKYPLLGLTASAPAESVAAIAEGMRDAAGVVAAGAALEAAGVAQAFAREAEAGTGVALQDAPPKTPHRLDTRQAVEVLERELPPLAYMLCPLRPPAVSQCGQKRAALWLLPAGWRTKDRFAEYGRAVQNFSWSEFYESYHGEAYFEWMRRQLCSEELADVVIIDSRTGLTEMGGVCTRQLADVVVSFTAPNLQNLNGVVRMAASFKKKDVLEARNKLEDGRGGRPLEVVVVPTRVEGSEKDQRNKFKDRFLEQLGDVPAPLRILRKTFWDLLIPYIPYYAYDETLAIGDPRGAEELQSAYKTLAAALVLLAPEGSALRVNFSEELRRVFGKMSPRVLAGGDDLSGEDPLREVRRRLRQEGVSLWDDYRDGATDDGEAPAQYGGSIDLVEHLLLPVTPEASREAWFLHQWRYARRHGVCVQLVDATPGGGLRHEELPLWLRDAHVYDPATEFDALVKVLKSPCSAARVPYMAPDLPEHYVERAEEVRVIVEALTGGEKGGETAGHNGGRGKGGKAAAGTKVALCGPGGFGKSTLATAVCHDERTLAAYGDGIVWVTLGQEANVESQLQNIYTALTGEMRDQTLSGLISTLTPRLEGRNFLLVVDEVWKAADLRPFLDLAGSGSVLFTTRDRGLAEELGAAQIQVEGMRPEESARMLAASAGVSAEGSAPFSGVAELLGNSPLALKLAGAALRERVKADERPEEALAHITREIDARGVVAFDRKDAASAPDLSVAKNIEASLSLLSEWEKDNFLKLANLPPGAETPVERLKLVWGLQGPEVLSLTKRLAALSLLKFDEGRKTVRMHALIQSFLAAQHDDPSILNAKVERAESFFASLTPDEQIAARLIFTRLVQLSGPGDQMPDLRRRYDFEKLDARAKQLLPLLEREQLVTLEANQNGERTSAQLTDDSLVQSWPRMRAWLDESREFLTWRQSLEPLVAEWESSKRHNVAVLLRGRELAAARSWRDDHKKDLGEAEELFINESERAEAARRSRAAKEFIAACVVLLLSVSAIVYLLWRGQRLARQEREEALKTLSATRVAEANPIAEALGSQESKEKSYREAVAAYERLLAANPKSAEVLNLLGDAYSGLGAYDPSAYDKAIEKYLEAINLDPNLAEAYLDLGTLYKLKGDQGAPQFYDRAVENYTQAIRRRPEYAEAFLGRADALKAKGDRNDPNSYDLAVADYTRVIAQFNRQDPDVYFKRASIYKTKGDNASAVADFQKVQELSDDPVLRVNAEENVKGLKVTPTPAPAPAEPRIFIQYNDPNDEVAVQRVAADLRAEGHRVVGRPQLSASLAKGQGDVRCFHMADYGMVETIALAVAASLYRQGFVNMIQPREPLKGYSNVPQGNIEVWIPPLRGKADAPEPVRTPDTRTTRTTR